MTRQGETNELQNIQFWSRKWRVIQQMIRMPYKQKKQLFIIYYLKNKMPRTEHLSNVNANHIYSLNAQVKYMHHTANMTTAIIEDENIQSKIRIPQSLNNIREEIQQGMNYHFGFCYIAPNGWIKARNPDNTIKPIQENPPVVLKPMLLSEIANNSQTLNSHYLTTLLYVVKVNESQQIVKNGRNLSMVILNCYANGFLVDVTFWNSDLPIADLTKRWIVFSGFRMKKLVDWKFVFVSSVYSKIAPYEGEPKSIPYSPLANYHNLSCVYQARTLTQILKFAESNSKFYSQTQALMKKVEVFTYEGCSVCKKKTFEGNSCLCAPNTDIKLYNIFKATLVGSDQMIMQASAFDEQVQNEIKNFKEPTVLKLNIKSTVKVLGTGERSQSHIISKVSL